MNLIKIKKKSDDRGITIRALSAKIGMSEQNLHRCIRDGRIEAGDLKQIALILDVPVSYFFDDDEGSNNDKSLSELVELQRKYISSLEKRLEAYESGAVKKVG